MAIRSVGLALAASVVVLRHGAAASGAAGAELEALASPGRWLETANWDVVYQGMVVNLSGEDGAIELRYHIGKDRQSRSEIFAEDCETVLGGITLDPDSLSPKSSNDTHDDLELHFTFNKTALADSSFWYDDESALKFCHRLTLIEPDQGYEISEDVRKININLDLTADFTIVQLVNDGTVYGEGPNIKACITMNSPSLTDEDKPLAADVIEKALKKHVKEVLTGGQIVHDTYVTVSPDTSTDFCYEIIVLEPVSEQCDPLNANTTDSKILGEFLIAHLNSLFPCPFPPMPPGTPCPFPASDEFATTLGEDEMFEGEVVDVTLFNASDPSHMCEPLPDEILGAVVDTADFVEGCQCDGPETFNCVNSTLAPSSELRLCIWVTSFVFDSLDRMEITQELPTAASLDVIEPGGNIAINAITSRENVATQNGVYVSTRVPTNRFEFEAGRSITIRGIVSTRLARRLGTAVDGAGHARALQADNEGGFNLQVMLVEEEELPAAEEPAAPSVLGKSAAAANQGIVIMGLVFPAFCAFFF